MSLPPLHNSPPEFSSADSALCLTTLGHELREPLNAIAGFSEAALCEVRGPLPAAYAEYFQAIRDAARHLAQVMNSVLPHNQERPVDAPTNRVSVPLLQLVQEARAMVALRASQKGVRLETLPDGGDWMLRVDPLRARQIFVNLLVNAVRFTPTGGTVGVEARETADPGALDIVVWDTGIGIPAEHHDRVFEVFFRGADGVATPEREPDEGLGIGLALSRHFARLLGGDIRLESEGGRGSRFTIRLPLAGSAEG